jgi:hypothetical protein
MTDTKITSGAAEVANCDLLLTVTRGSTVQSEVMGSTAILPRVASSPEETYPTTGIGLQYAAASPRTTPGPPSP